VETFLLEDILDVREPWKIDRATLNVSASCLDVWIAHATDASWPCPECHTPLRCHEHGAEQVWRHLDTCQFRTLLHASVPRVACPRHAVRDVSVPWTDGGGRCYTAAMTQHIIDHTERCGVASASRALRMDWNEVWRLMISRRIGT
jgi:transposase